MSSQPHLRAADDGTYELLIPFGKGSVQNALAAGRFPLEAEKLRLYRAIATMDRSAPLPALQDQKPNWAKAAFLARAWQLIQLAERLDALEQAQQDIRGKKEQNVPKHQDTA
jgi:hypothetical protein